jgi:molybdate transport system ATP-binding protein
MAASLKARIRRKILDLDLEVTLGGPPVTVVFGPSGSGKTTLLRCLAGLDRPDTGCIIFDDQIWDDPRRHLPTRQRRVGYLFQDHALFPHLSVSANVAYGLHRLPKHERAGRATDALRTAGAAHLADRSARQLSGGEAQRVALARALAPAPRLLLLDEPLSALDAPTRIQLRTELRAVLARQTAPTLLVTHDRTEALALGDRVAVLIDGHVRQLGAVEDVFSRPADPQVARVVGVETTLPGHVRGRSDGLLHLNVGGQNVTAVDPGHVLTTDVLVCIRAEDVAIELPGQIRHTSPRNHWPGIVTVITADGPLLRVDIDCGFPLQAFVTRPARDELRLSPGAHVVAAVKTPAVHVIPRGMA